MNTVGTLNGVSLQRLADDLWKLVRIPSPTCREREIALAFASMLSAAGAEVEIDETFPGSPAVIGRLKGNRPGATLQLAGHLDHIDVPQDEPTRDAKIISGRGTRDMKCGLASILEIVRLLKEGGCDFPGEVLVTAYGLHEEPGGNTRGIAELARKGVTGDAAIVLEGPADTAITASNGLARWDVTVRQAAPACHEVCAAPDRDELQKTFLEAVSRVREMDEEFRARQAAYPHLRRESIFIGQIHYGDFFNRVPNECRLQGSRRWQPDRGFAEVEAEFREMLESVPRSPGVSIEPEMTFIGHSYEIDPEEPVIRSLLRASREVAGRELGVTAPGRSARSSFGVCDVQRLVVEGGVPAVPFGPGGDPMHAGHTDHEHVELDRLHTCCRIVLAAVRDYLDGQAEGGVK